MKSVLLANFNDDFGLTSLSSAFDNFKLQQKLKSICDQS